ncbi:c-type cytochrome [Ramlibacter sp. USB13]|uniref:C-type cytochrome n=1 Tax=Ramlibacter cellulosilyticus TaxID=2764187 RepID=A0A923MWE3_9BURK|nr:c-type cytochrome [Ramlibacter cellulosilyticus]MBC5784972.1 c-type cytochrome [Ramlibacter cellulosilyticus]
MPTLRPAALSTLVLAVLLAAAPAAADPVERGRALLVQYRCGSCHTIPGVPVSRGQVAPPLTAWGQRSYIAGRLPNRPDVLARWIVAPQSLVPGTWMPSMGVSPAEAEAMAAYLFSLE